MGNEDIRSATAALRASSRKKQGRRKLTLLGAGCCLLAFSLGSVAQEVPRGEWRTLFDGNRMDGLVTEPAEQAQYVEVQDGVIRIYGSSEGGWLRTDRKYDNFTMTFDIRYVETDVQHGNSIHANNGLILRSPEISLSGRNWPGRGVEMELWDQSARPGGFAKDGTILGLQPGAPTGLMFFDIGAAQRSYRPTGEWHSVKIIADGNRMWTWQNGEWLSAAFNVATPDGHVGYQIEDGITEIRNIRIMEHTADSWTPNRIVPLFKDGELRGLSISDPAFAENVRIENGLLRLEGPGGWLKSDNKYTSYLLRLQFRMLAPNTNGGVYLRASLDEDNRPHWTTVNDPEMGYSGNTDMIRLVRTNSPPPTLAAGDPRWIGTLLSRGTPGGRTYLDTSAVVDAFRGVGEWHEMVIEVDGTEFRTTLNGTLISYGDNIANLEEGGYVGLEIGTGVTEFRLIEIQGYIKE